MADACAGNKDRIAPCVAPKENFPNGGNLGGVLSYKTAFE
jgi:hypothetical protein